MFAFRLDVTSPVIALALDDKSPSPDNVLIQSAVDFAGPMHGGGGRGAQAGRGHPWPVAPPTHHSIPSQSLRVSFLQPTILPIAVPFPAVTLFILFSGKVVHMACIIQAVPTRTVVLVVAMCRGRKC